MTSLKRKRLELSTVLLGAGLQPVRPEFEEGPLNSWLRALPMCFNPDSDRKHWYTRLTWVQHCRTFAGNRAGNRHGAPRLQLFQPRRGYPDIRSAQQARPHPERASAVVRPDRAGKSATLCAALSQLMAVHRPRLFIAEAGNSFGLLADFFDSLGLTVNKISVKPGSGVSLPPFADAHKLVEEGPPPVPLMRATCRISTRTTMARMTSVTFSVKWKSPRA